MIPEPGGHGKTRVRACNGCTAPPLLARGYQPAVALRALSHKAFCTKKMDVVANNRLVPSVLAQGRPKGTHPHLQQLAAPLGLRH